MPVSREKLYEEVWAEPMLKVAARYGVSSSFLARVCRRMNVPCPARGYWARKSAGMKIKVPALPSPEPGDELAWIRDGERVPRQPYPSPSIRRARGAKPSPARIDETGRHAHLVGIEALFEKATVMSNDYLKPSKRLLADIYATKKSLPRVIEAASQLYLHLEGKGYRVGFCPAGVYFHRPGLAYCEGKTADQSSYYGLNPARPTLVYFGTMPIGLTVFEQSEEVEAQQRGGKWVRISDIPPSSGRRRSYEPTYYTSTHEFKTRRIALRAYSPYKAVPCEDLLRSSVSCRGWFRSTCFGEGGASPFGCRIYRSQSLACRISFKGPMFKNAASYARGTAPDISLRADYAEQQWSEEFREGAHLNFTASHPVDQIQSDTTPLSYPSISLLEHGFPFKELSMLITADRRGRDPGYSVHRWWARRPPTLIRGILLAAFTPNGSPIEEYWRRFASEEFHLEGKRVHDPFLGGGSTVVEASRLGATTSGTDVDPLACLIARHELMPPAASKLKQYGDQLADYLLEKMIPLYSFGKGKANWTPLHWFWIHIVECPGCRTESPLYRNLIIARDLKKPGAVVRDYAQTVFCPDCFKIHHLKSGETKRLTCCSRHDLTESTFSKLKFQCPCCGKSSDHSALKTLKSRLRLLAVEETHGEHRRRIRAPRAEDRLLIRLVDEFLEANGAEMALPTDAIAQPRRDSRPLSYGAELHTDLFHPRQLAIFGTAFAWIRDCGADPKIKEALSLAASHALAFNNKLCGYATDYGRLSALFSVRSYSLPALSVELNPLHPTAGRGTLIKLLRERLTEHRNIVNRAIWSPESRSVSNKSYLFSQKPPTSICCDSALNRYPFNEEVDFSFFDPPYFDYISYSELSEFYRVWLGCSKIGGAPLLPTGTDPVLSFATVLAKCIEQLRSKLQPEAPFAFTFHSTSESAWTAIATALRLASERITAIWPVLADPHMGHHGAKGACEWDLVIVCRPARICQPGRGPSITRWERKLAPLVVKEADKQAFQIALQALRGIFGSRNNLASTPR